MSSFLGTPRQQSSTLLPYTTLFRSANTGGPQMNIIGKQGGNRFAGSFFITGTGDKFQGTNLTPELQAQGLSTPQSLAKADRKSTRLNSSHLGISYAVFCLKKISQVL